MKALKSNQMDHTHVRMHNPSLYALQQPALHTYYMGGNLRQNTTKSNGKVNKRFLMSCSSLVLQTEKKIVCFFLILVLHKIDMFVS